jgi:hypothetical protein
MRKVRESQIAKVGHYGPRNSPSTGKREGASGAVKKRKSLKWKELKGLTGGGSRMEDRRDEAIRRRGRGQLLAPAITGEFQSSSN